MTALFKKYKLTIKTLSPLVICSGEKRSIFELYFSENDKRVYLLNLQKILQNIPKNKITELYTRIKGANSLENVIPDFITTFESTKQEYSLYSMKCLNYTDIQSKGEFNTFIRNIYNQPYIPGSSVKGALRTAIIYNLILNNNDLLTNIKDTISKILNSNEIDKNKRNEIKKIESKLVNELFDTEFGNIMRILKISDSNTLDKNSLELIKIQVKDVYEANEGTSIITEAINEKEKDIELDVSIDLSILGNAHRPHPLLSILENFENEMGNICEFYRDNRESKEPEANFRLGLGIGFSFVTICRIFDDGIRKKMLDLFWPKGKKNKIRPATSKFYNNQTLGWCKLNIQKM